MTYKNIDEILQWTGAVAIVLGHAFNAMGPVMYPWNITVFAIGTVMFLLWALRVGNRPQMMVNVVSLAIGILGLVKAAS
jgi:Na+-driven multidrug efflux pump